MIWEATEKAAFLALHKVAGRHVIVNFGVAPNAHPNPLAPQNQFARDDSLRALAAMDMTELYRFLTPPKVNLAIPFGDASTEHTESSPDLGAGSYGQRGASGGLGDEGLLERAARGSGADD